MTRAWNAMTYSTNFVVKESWGDLEEQGEGEGEVVGDGEDDKGNCISIFKQTDK